MLKIYTTTYCADCTRVKHYLITNNIAFTEINIEKDTLAMQFVKDINNGYESVPTIIFPDGSTLTEPSITTLKLKLDNYLFTS